jgi:Cu/Ag efflux protein CusF
MKSIAPALFLIVLGLPAAAIAQVSADRPAAAGSAADSPALADGEVRQVDRETGRITLRHGPIPSLDMPPMSMVFRVKNPGLLDGVKPGDKVKFRAEKAGSQYFVTHIEPAK